MHETGWCSVSVEGTDYLAKGIFIRRCETVYHICRKNTVNVFKYIKYHFVSSSWKDRWDWSQPQGNISFVDFLLWWKSLCFEVQAYRLTNFKWKLPCKDTDGLATAMSLFLFLSMMQLFYSKILASLTGTNRSSACALLHGRPPRIYKTVLLRPIENETFIKRKPQINPSLLLTKMWLKGFFVKAMTLVVDTDRL